MNVAKGMLLGGVCGFLGGAALNMGVVMVGGKIFALPEGTDPGDMDSIKANIERFRFVNFLPALAAHALGTFSSAYIAAAMVPKPKVGELNGPLVMASLMGSFYFVAGLGMSYYIPEAPLWFHAFDLTMAYFPMAYAAYYLITTS